MFPTGLLYQKVKADSVAVANASTGFLGGVETKIDYGEQQQRPGVDSVLPLNAIRYKMKIIRRALQNIHCVVTLA